MTVKKGTPLLALATLAMSLGLAGCNIGGKVAYTYRTWTTALGEDWNPHTWETNSESSMLDYLSEPLIDMAPLDTSKLSWQWVYRAAKSVTDVSQDHVADLEKYGVQYKENDLTGYVFEIELNPNLMFEEKKVTVNGKKKTYGGKKITAQDYIESAKLMLDSSYRNYRANNYYSSDSAIANAKQFYDSEYLGLVPTTDAYDAYDANNDGNMYFYGSKSNKNGSSWLVNWFVSKYASYASYVTNYGPGAIYWLFGYDDAASPAESQAVADFEKLDGKTYREIKADPELKAIFDGIYAFWGPESDDEQMYFFYSNYQYPKFDWENVGLYAKDDHTLIYVLAGQSDIDNFKVSLTSNWLVETELYKDLSYKDDTTGLMVTKYGSSVDTSISCGPYKLTTFEAEKQLKYAQNPQWWAWEKKTGGRYVTTTEKFGYKVNGEYQPAYQTTDVVMDVMNQATAKQKFEKGELNDYTPTATELINDYNLSSQLYQVDETYTMRFFLDTNLSDLQKMDAAGTNANGVVMSNETFRKAFSLAVNRADWVTTTEGYKPAYSLINSLYYYDVFNDPESIYRNTPQAMQAICNVYGVEYGQGKQYATLEEAYKSITGYNLTEARALMKEAHDELVAAGLYTSGDIKFTVAYMKGELTATERTQVAKIEEYLNAAVEGSGFGKVVLEAKGNINDRYGDVGTQGLYAIGYGAWGGAAFYPFTMFRVYMDPDYADLHSGRCWDPTTEKLTMVVDNEEVTMTYQDWANFSATGGAYVNASNETKLNILANLEEDYLQKYYDIPLATSTSCFLLGYQQSYFTEEYNIMYGFGGMALMKYNYTDSQWKSFVKKSGGTLNYK